VDGERFGAGKAELLEEVDSWGGRSVGVAVEFLMGGSGGRPRCVCKRKNAMRSGALEGFEVHFGGVGFVGSKREWTNGVVAKEESAEHWAHAAVGTYCPNLE